MRLIIARHGETFANEKNLACGWYNSRLNDIGKKQAEKLASRLMNEKIDFIFCSDLARCKQTIKPYLEKVKSKIKYTKLLREQSYGIFDGKPTKQMIEWFAKNPGSDPKGWETKDKLKERITNFINNDLSKLKGKTVLVVTHGRAKKAILEVLFSKDKEIQERIKENVSNTAVSIIDISDKENPKLELLNCKKHLEN